MKHIQKRFWAVIMILQMQFAFAQPVFSELERHQPRPLDTYYTVNYGVQSLLQNESGLIRVQDQTIHWISPVLTDGVIYHIKREGGQWLEVPIYPKVPVKQSINGDQNFLNMAFGWSFDANEHMLVVGAPFYAKYPAQTNMPSVKGGGVYTFIKNTKGDWVEHDILTDHRQLVSENFGRKVLLHQNTLFVFSLKDLPNDPNSGVVTVFERSHEKWVPKQVIKPHINPEKHNFFGINMAADARNLVLVSTYIEDRNNLSAGSYRCLWFYEKSPATHRWEFAQMIVDSSGIWGSELTQYKFYGNELFEGLPNDDGSTSGLTPKIPLEGSLIIYKRNENSIWLRNQIIRDTQRQENGFGISHYRYGDLMFVSAPRNENLGVVGLGRPNSGAFFAMKKVDGVWEFISKFHAPQVANDHFFGHLSGFEDRLLITLPGFSSTLINQNPSQGGIIGEFRPNIFYTMDFDSIATDTASRALQIFTIYPNPAKDQITIAFETEVHLADFQIFNMNGQIVQTATLRNDWQIAIPLDYLAPGLYALRILNQQDDQTFKFIKL
jgi:hypothetical protein